MDLAPRSIFTSQFIIFINNVYNSLLINYFFQSLIIKLFPFLVMTTFCLSRHFSSVVSSLGMVKPRLLPARPIRVNFLIFFSFNTLLAINFLLMLSSNLNLYIYLALIFLRFVFLFLLHHLRSRA